ncbi:MAG: DUF4150 domain-containing protein [Rhodanobacteraceae bacterium]|nr:DUF4150 domain-containing protein [Rhodanobacteraceae bacterium]
MNTYVYANGNEIASKAANGRSAAAFPDVCFSPPTPPPSGVPVPYPNTCFAKDISNGSRTVFIKRKEIAIEDKAYFKTSTGDEPATPALKKGVISSKIKGRCYFMSWSPNVKVEGLCVDRHLDTVTHNHRNPPNALVQKYRSIFTNDAACAQDNTEIKNKCKTSNKPNDDDSKPKIKKRRRGFTKMLEKVVEFPDEIARDLYGFKRVNGKNDWVDEHCGGLWVKPTTLSDEFNKAKEQLDKIMNLLQQDKLTIVQTVFFEMLGMAKDQLGLGYVLRKGGGLAVRALLKNIVGGAAGTTGVGLVVTGAMAAWTVTDFISTATELAEKLGPLGQEHLDDLLDIDKLKQKAMDKLKGYQENPMQAVADMQTAAAKLNACVKARKCMLVPFNKTDARDAAKSGEGCCPGQTGHHVMPGAMFEGNSCYDNVMVGARPLNMHNNAPTICVEGVNNSHGSHGQAHAELKKQLQNRGLKNGDPVDYDKARDASVAAIREAGAGHCSEECLKKQLDAYYDKCKDKKLRAHSGENSKDADSSGGGAIPDE